MEAKPLRARTDHTIISAGTNTHGATKQGVLSWDEKKDGGWKERMDERKSKQGFLGGGDPDDADPDIALSVIFASLFFIALFISIFATGILELRRSGVSIEEWRRNEQFWVIGGIPARLFAVIQGLLKVLAGIDANFTFTSKATDDKEFGELYNFKWTTLSIPPTTVLIINIISVVAGIFDTIDNRVPVMRAIKPEDWQSAQVAGDLLLLLNAHNVLGYEVPSGFLPSAQEWVVAMIHSIFNLVLKDKICTLHVSLFLDVGTMGSHEQMDLLSHAWCNSAIQVFQPSVDDCPNAFKERQLVGFENDKMLQKSDMSLIVDEGDLRSSTSQLKFDDLKSWIWLQKAIHPELDYDLCMRKKWDMILQQVCNVCGTKNSRNFPLQFSKNIIPWKEISIRKWLKEMKQKRKEEERLQRAEVHAAISVAGVAAALAAIAAENLQANQHKSLRDTAVASAAALVAARCAHVAEAAGAKREQISSAIDAAATATDAANIFTLTAAAATSMKGAATLRGRQGQRQKTKGSSPALLCDDFGFDLGRCRASLAKGDEILVATEDGKCRLRSVSAILNRDAKVILRIKKTNALMVFSTAKESVVYELDTNPLEEPRKEADGSYCIGMRTSQGKIELKTDDYVQYKKWFTTINHMLMLSSTLGRKELHLIRTSWCSQNAGTC
ncbi:hypothetical protein OPV22_024302 [Ensete ventricosum]|uniref:PH domain-containing protein n=1 Tax=Ensete ventricosum TaxID=4639 RepID=A0AAV8PDT2_ENSVE|nr:hypothetical protein OPV22_024302 [Ensete ventricosum]